MPFLTIDGELVSIHSKLSAGGAKSTRGYHLTTDGDHIIPTYIEPGPLMDPLEQAEHTPFSTLRSIRVIGKIPFARSVQLDATERPYYMQNDTGKLCLTRYTPRLDPNTAPQQAQRQTLKDANAAWSALSPEEQESYRHHPLAKDKNLPSRQTFISLYMRGKL
jgi:hypothetical protein